MGTHPPLIGALMIDTLTKVVRIRYVVPALVIGYAVSVGFGLFNNFPAANLTLFVVALVGLLSVAIIYAKTATEDAARVRRPKVFDRVGTAFLAFLALTVVHAMYAGILLGDAWAELSRADTVFWLFLPDVLIVVMTASYLLIKGANYRKL